MTDDGFSDLRVLQGWNGRREFVPADPRAFREALLESPFLEVSEIAGVSFQVVKRIARDLGVTELIRRPRGRKAFEPDPAEFRLRLRSGWTQGRLAEEYGVTKRTVDRTVAKLGLRGVGRRVNQWA